MYLWQSLVLFLALPAWGGVEARYRDGHHDSKVFAGPRSYRIFLPPQYEISGQRYPVIYYFHGHSDRYTLEKYDGGLDTVPKIATFVAAHDVIVVAADGYVARDYTGFYGGSPYDVRRDGGDFDYGSYFLELVHHIDSTYRTLTSRRYRATCGLSMGGFMSLYLSARYPDLVGSASAFNPGPEFYVGEKGRRSLWRPKDHVTNHEHSMVRLVRASGDFISQYHEETRAAYAHAPGVEFEFRQDEYHRHWATSIGETFEFHTRAFANPGLDATPEEWSYTSAQQQFSVRGVRVEANVQAPALIELEHVTQGGLGLRTRRWAPDGPPAACTQIRLKTAPLYRPGMTYKVFDYQVGHGDRKAEEIVADPDGRLEVAADCSEHEFSFGGPGTGAQRPIALPLTGGDAWRVRPGVELTVPLHVYNPRGTAVDVRAELTSAYPTAEVLSGSAQWKSIAAGQSVTPSPALRVRFAAADRDWERVRLDLRLTYDGWVESTQSFDVWVAPDRLRTPEEISVLDGRERTFTVFRQRGNQGGGSAVSRTVREGRGNGNGILEPGEEATIWLRLPQGLDPFDKNNWCRAKVYVDSPWLTETADIQEEKQREWTGAQNRTSLMALSSGVPSAATIPVVLDCESWSFTFTPDVRYGKELLYQAFQFHRHDLFAWTWQASHHPSSSARRKP